MCIRDSFMHRTPERLVSYLSRDFDVEVLVYLRRQDDWANSQYVEFVAGGAISRESGSPEEWLRTEKVRYFLDYAGLLDAWAACEDTCAVHVRPYEPEQWVDGKLLNDFAAAVGIEALDTLPVPSDRESNGRALGVGYVSLLRNFNALPFECKQHYLRFVAAVEEGAPPSEERERVEVLGPALRAQIRGRAVAGNQQIARRYLARPNGDLFLRPPNDPERSEGTLPSEEVERIFRVYFRERGNPQPSRAGGAAVVKSKDATGRSGGKKRFAKLRKLIRDPEQFLADSKVPAAATIRQAIYDSGAPKSRSVRKLRKLARDPAAFFADSKLGPLHVLGTALESKRKGK